MLEVGAVLLILTREREGGGGAAAAAAALSLKRQSSGRHIGLQRQDGMLLGKQEELGALWEKGL
jgi:hypothetical protein